MLRFGLVGQIIYTYLAGFLLVACYPQQNSSNSSQVSNDGFNEAKPIINLIYKDIIENSKLDFLIIPISISPDPNSNDGLPLLTSRDTDKVNNTYNLIFYNKANNKSHPLLNKKAIINSFELIEIPVAKPEIPPQTLIQSSQTKKFWIYRIIDQDTNGDGKLTPEDAIIGYISTGDGKNLVPVTPGNTQMKSWKLITDMNAVFISVTFDSDNDKQFNNRDRTTYIRVNLDQLEPGKEMIDTDVEEKIKSALEK